MTGRRSIGIAILGVCCVGLSVACAFRPEEESSSKLPTPNYVLPPGSPSLASWADTFDYSFAGPPVSGAPQLGPVISQAQNADSVNLGGVFAADTTFLALGQTANGQAKVSRPTVRRLVANRAILTLPSDLPANSLYLLYAQDSSGRRSLPVPINRAETWWLNGSTTGSANVIVGDTVSVYGRNLSNALRWSKGAGYDIKSPSTKCAIWLSSSYSGVTIGQFVTCTSINPYRATFVMPQLYVQTTSNTTTNFVTGNTATLTTPNHTPLPAGLPVCIHNPDGRMLGTVVSDTGTTLVLNITVSYVGNVPGSNWTIDPMPAVSCYVHNGHGGQYGWSSPVTINVACLASALIDYGRCVINLPAPSGDTTGATDTAMINTKLALVQSPSGYATEFTLIAQSGTYHLNNRALLQNGGLYGGKVVGNGARTTIFKAASGFSDSSSHNAIFYSNATAELNSLTVDCSLAASAKATCVTVRNVNCTFTYPYPFGAAADHVNSVRNITPNIGQGLYLTGCTLNGMGVYGQAMPFAYVDNCNFYGTFNVDLLFIAWGAANVHFNNITAQDYNVITQSGSLNDRGGGRIFGLATTNFGSCRNIYTANVSTPTRYTNSGYVNWGGDSELFFTEAGLGTQSSRATAATSTTVTIADSPSGGWTSVSLSRDALVTDGQGSGQGRGIVSVSGNTLTLDRAWALIPAVGSRINICGTFSRMVAHNWNVIGGNILSDGSAQGDSIGGSCTYGGGYDVVVDGGTYMDMNYGFTECSAGGGGFNCGIPNFFNLYQNCTFNHCNVAVKGTAVGATAGETALFMGNMRRNLTWTNTVYGGWATHYYALVDLDVWQSCTINGNLLRGVYNEDNVYPINATAGSVNTTLIDTTITGGGRARSVATRLGTGYAGNAPVLFGTSVVHLFASGNGP